GSAGGDRAAARDRGDGRPAGRARRRGRRRAPDRRPQHAELHAPRRGRRGPSSSVDELLLAAEYVVNEGNPRVILCERGIRTFERSTRYTLDLGAVPVLKEETHLPVIVDPSHAAGRRSLVPALARAAVAAG